MTNLRELATATCPNCGHDLRVVEEARGIRSTDIYVPPKTPDLERLHLLHTVMDYGPLCAKEIASRYNTECKYDEFDPLPVRSVQSIAGSLRALCDEGLVRRLDYLDPVEWKIAPAGAEVADSYIGTEYAESSTPEGKQ